MGNVWPRLTEDGKVACQCDIDEDDVECLDAATSDDLLCDWCRSRHGGTE